jgi:hypothetical protein
MQPRARTSQVGLRGFDVVDTGDGVRCTDLALSGVASRRDPGVTGRRSVRILDWPRREALRSAQTATFSLLVKYLFSTVLARALALSSGGAVAAANAAAASDAAAAAADWHHDAEAK